MQPHPLSSFKKEQHLWWKEKLGKRSNKKFVSSRLIFVSIVLFGWQKNFLSESNQFLDNPTSCKVNPAAYLEPTQTPKMVLFAEIVHDF